jgi:hypothetical protein
LRDRESTKWPKHRVTLISSRCCSWQAGKVAKFAASNKTLPPGDWKYFCESDCHIAYSIDSTQEAAM